MSSHCEMPMLLRHADIRTGLPPIVQGVRGRTRISSELLPYILSASDAATILATGLASGIGYHLAIERGVGDLGQHLGSSLSVLLLFLVLGQARGLYGPSWITSWKRQAYGVALIWTIIFLSLASLAFALKVGDIFSRGAVLLFFATGLLGLALSRLGLDRMVFRLESRGLVARRRIAVLSDTRRVRGLSVVSLLEGHGCAVARVFLLPAAPRGARVLQDKAREQVRDLIRFARQSAIDEVLLVVRWTNPAIIQGIIAELRALPLPVKLAPDPRLGWLLDRSVGEIGPTKLVELQHAPLTLSQRAAKRALDLIGAGAALVLLAPLLAAAAVAVSLDSSGPILFRQTRAGFNGRTFRIFKFRTMTALEDGPVVRQACRGDRRVTRVGRVLRKYSIDELPQLLNVLAGDMSLVGPRPHALAHDETYDRAIAAYAVRQNMKPGMTGWAQVNGCRGETAQIGAMERRVDLDIAYIERWSIWLDLRILVLTVRAVLRPVDVY